VRQLTIWNNRRPWPCLEKGWYPVSSSTDETPTAGYGPVDEDTRLRKLDEWSKNLVSISKHVCGKKNDGTDEAGHNRWPCQECMIGVRKVTSYWHGALLLKSKAVRYRAEREGIELPMVDLATAFFLASSLLDPETAVTLGNWGAA
jgi:hypothetical protein